MTECARQNGGPAAAVFIHILVRSGETELARSEAGRGLHAAAVKITAPPQIALLASRVTPLPTKLFWRHNANPDIVDASTQAIAKMPASATAVTDQRHMVPDRRLRLDETERLRAGGDCE
jgi:hypothetical protein